MKKNLLTLTLAVLMIVGVTACASLAEDEKKGLVPEFSVTVVTADGEKTLTDETIVDVAVVEKELVKSTKKGEYTNTWTGVALNDALKALDITEFTKLTVEASDGYSQEYTSEMVDSAILAYRCDGELLGEDGPVETVIDGQSGNLWMKNLVKITVE